MTAYFIGYSHPVVAGTKKYVAGLRQRKGSRVVQQQKASGRTPIYVALGALVLAAGVALVLLGPHKSDGPAQPVAASGIPPSSQPVAGATRPGKTMPPRAQPGSQTLPPAAGGGDHYARNVTPGATCSPAGAHGFATHGKVVQCATTSSDPRPRWRQ